MSWQLVSLNARIPPGDHSQAEIDGMIRVLLEERYGLATHRESRPQRAYVLLGNKTGPNLTPSSSSQDKSLVCRFENGPPTRFVCSNATMNGVALILQTWLHSLVVDETGLQGAYQVTLEIAPDDLARLSRLGGTAPDDFPGREEAPSLLNTLDRLGLKLEMRRAPVEYLVIDKISRHPLEN